MADVLLATSADFPDGEPGGQLLLDALAERGIAARFAIWDDPAVDWEAARLVLVRSTWDYDGRRDEFLAWCRKVGDKLVNSVEAIAWNTDKAYLVDLGQTSLPVVPTVAVDEEGEIGPAVAAFAPEVPADEDASPLRELGALKRPQVWLTLGIGAIGFGGLLAVYTYLADMLLSVTHMSLSTEPWVIGVFGIGLTAGNMIVPAFADRALMRTAGVLLVWSMAMLAATHGVLPKSGLPAADSGSTTRLITAYTPRP